MDNFRDIFLFFSKYKDGKTIITNGNVRECVHGILHDANDSAVQYRERERGGGQAFYRNESPLFPSVWSLVDKNRTVRTNNSTLRLKSFLSTNMYLSIHKLCRSQDKKLASSKGFSHSRYIHKLWFTIKHSYSTI